MLVTIWCTSFLHTPATPHLWCWYPHVWEENETVYNVIVELLHTKAFVTSKTLALSLCMVCTLSSI